MGCCSSRGLFPDVFHEWSMQTSGLDSASSYYVMAAIQRLAKGGRTILTTIHQPSSEVFALFDKLMLLSAGRTVYFGTIPGAFDVFSRAGFPVPANSNPSDFFLMTINRDFMASVQTPLLRASLVPLEPETSPHFAPF